MIMNFTNRYKILDVTGEAFEVETEYNNPEVYMMSHLMNGVPFLSRVLGRDGKLLICFEKSSIKDCNGEVKFIGEVVKVRDKLGIIIDQTNILALSDKYDMTGLELRYKSQDDIDSVNFNKYKIVIFSLFDRIYRKYYKKLGILVKE